jgi:peptidoglycan/LPS O-acetylase OafA/YrhL
LAIILFGPHDSIGITHKYYRAWGLSLLLGVLYAHVEEGQSKWIHKVSHWIAEHSYGIYLSHEFVLWIAFYRMTHFPLWAQITALIAGAVGIPALLYLLIEKPLILLGGRIAKRVLGNSGANVEQKLA